MTKALILQGELTIRASGTERVYRTGDIFHLGAQIVHEERYGSMGSPTWSAANSS